MSFLNIGKELAERQEETAVPEGEYKLRIIAAEIPEGKNYLLVRCEIVGQPFAREVSGFYTLPGFGRDDKEENRNRNRLGYLFECFAIDPNGNYDVSQPAPEGFVNREGWALLGPPTDDGKGYGAQNRISRLIAAKR